MAKITTITNPLTGQPAQVDQLEHTAQEIDDAIARALPGGAIDITLANKLGGIESTDYPGCYYRTVDGVTEWVNPPMLIGVEYRTTERYQGKPVYAVCVDVGSAPQGLQMSSLVGFSQYTGIEKVIRLNARTGNRSLPSAFGGTNSILWGPEGFNAFPDSYDNRLYVRVGSTGTTNTAVVFDNIQVTVFYTKIAD